MTLLGKESEGGRWDTKALGVGILGTEVRFSRSHKRGGEHIDFTHTLERGTLYGNTFVKEMNKTALLFREHTNVYKASY